VWLKPVGVAFQWTDGKVLSGKLNARDIGLKERSPTG